MLHLQSYIHSCILRSFKYMLMLRISVDSNVFDDSFLINLTCYELLQLSILLIAKKSIILREFKVFQLKIIIVTYGRREIPHLQIKIVRV